MPHSHTVQADLGQKWQHEALERPEKSPSPLGARLSPSPLPHSHLHLRSHCHLPGHCPAWGRSPRVPTLNYFTLQGISAPCVLTRSALQSPTFHVGSAHREQSRPCGCHRTWGDAPGVTSPGCTSLPWEVWRVNGSLTSGQVRKNLVMQAGFAARCWRGRGTIESWLFFQRNT